MAVLSAPIVLRYDGLDAENHQVDLADLGISLLGASRMIALSANFAYTGRVITREPALQVRVLGGIAKDGCWQIPIFIAPLVPVLPDIYQAISSNLVGALVNWTLAKFGGRPKEAEMFRDIAIKAIEANEQISKHAISEMRLVAESVIDAQKPAAKKLVRPVGETCETLRIGFNQESIKVDRPMKDAISEAGNIETLDERNYVVLFSELDRRNKTGKLSIKDDPQPQKRYSSIITDPKIDEADNIYAESLSAEKWITVRGKLQIKDNEPYRIYISAGAEGAAKIVG